MTKEILKKISVPFTPLDVNDLTSDEKKDLASSFAKRGFTASTFYLRFFQKGFSKWEIDGVKECKRQFLNLPEVAKALLDYEESDRSLPGDKGYFYTLAMSEKPGEFYACLKNANMGLCNRFIEFMGERGMSSGTVIKRFTNDCWKPWEREGVKALLESFLA
mgnify:FL=1